MSNNLKSENRIAWINTIKLLSCFFVFVSHYYSCFFYLAASDNMSSSLRTLIILVQKFANGTPWVMIFCFISGVFATKKQINSFKEFLFTSVNRYFRLVVPMFFAGIIIYILSQAGLFLTQSAADILACSTFFDTYYTNRIGIDVLLKGLFLFDNRLNAPLWMMGMLYAGNVVIYFCNYISCVLKNKKIKYLLYIAIACACIVTDRLFVVACVCGALLSGYITENKAGQITRASVTIISVILIVTASMSCFSGMYTELSQIMDLNRVTVRSLISVCGFMLLCGSVPAISRMLSADILKKASNYSFTVFFVHWPIMCSLSLLMYKIMLPIMSYDMVFIITFIATAVIVAIVSWAYTKAFKNTIDTVLEKIQLQ